MPIECVFKARMFDPRAKELSPATCEKYPYAKFMPPSVSEPTPPAKPYRRATVDKPTAKAPSPVAEPLLKAVAREVPFMFLSLLISNIGKPDSSLTVNILPVRVSTTLNNKPFVPST